MSVPWSEAFRSGLQIAQAEYVRLRGRWEYGRSVLVETQRGGALERAARSSAALFCLLAGVACGGERGDATGDEAGPSLPDTLVMQARGPLDRRPVAPLRIDGACPFECCTYGTWTTSAETILYEQPDPASTQRPFPAGTRVEAATGFVLVTQIGVAVARDTVHMYTENGAERLAAAGDTLFVLDNVGEGFRRVWHDGAVLQTDAVSGIVPEKGLPAAEVLVEPRQEWWARIRTAEGVEGWLWMDRTERMEGADACG